MSNAEIDHIMSMSEDELRAELAKDGETLESAAARGREAFEKAKTRADMQLAIKAWLKCPAEKRPSAQSLGLRIQILAEAYQKNANQREEDVETYYMVKPFRKPETPILDYKVGLALRCGACGNEDQHKFLTVTSLAGSVLHGFVCRVCEERKNPRGFDNQQETHK